MCFLLLLLPSPIFLLSGFGPPFPLPGIFPLTDLLLCLRLFQFLRVFVSRKARSSRQTHLPLAAPHRASLFRAKTAPSPPPCNFSPLCSRGCLFPAASVIFLGQDDLCRRMFSLFFFKCNYLPLRKCCKVPIRRPEVAFNFFRVALEDNWRIFAFISLLKRFLAWRLQVEPLVRSQSPLPDVSRGLLVSSKSS